MSDPAAGETMPAKPAAAPAPEARNRPSKPSRVKKTLIIAGASVVGLVLLALLLVPPVVGAVAKSKIRSILSEKLGAEVSVEDVDFRWSGRVSVAGLRIVPRGFSDPFLDVRKIDVDLDLLAALKGSYLARVEVAEPRLRVEKSAAGSFNYEFPQAPPKSSAGKEGDEPSRPPVVRAALHVRDGRVVVRAQGRETQYGNLAVDATINTLEKPVDYSLTLTGAGGDKVQARGSLDLLRLSGPVTFVLENVSLRNLSGVSAAYSPILELDGRANGVLEYRLEGKLRFGGKAHVDVADLAAVLTGGRSVRLDRLAFTHEGALDEKGDGRHTFVIAAGKALGGTLTADLRDAFGARVVHADLKFDSDLAALGKILRPLRCLPAGSELSGLASLRGAVDSRGPTEADLRAGNVLPETSSWNLSLIASAPGLALDGKPMKLDRVDIVDQGTLDGRGNVRSTITLTSGKAITATVEAEGKDVLGAGRSFLARLKADSDLAELGNAVEKLVGIKQGMAVEGKAALSGTLEAKGADLVKADLDLKAAEVVAVDLAQKKRYELDRAISARLSAAWDGATKTATADAAKLESSFATLDAKGGVALGGKELEIKASTLRLDADLEKLSGKLAHFVQDPPVLAGRVKADATYAGDRYTLGAQATGVKIVTREKTIGPIDAQLDQRGTFAGGTLKIDVSELRSSAANVTVSGQIAKMTEAGRQGALSVNAAVKPAELSRWIPGLGWGGPDVRLTASAELKEDRTTLAGQTKLDGLTMSGQDEKGQPVTRTARTGAVDFTVEMKGKSVSAAAKAATFEWIEKSYAARGGLDARLTYDEKGSTGTTRIVNLEVVDDKKNRIHEPAVTVVHDIAFGSIDIRKLEVTCGFLKGAVRGKILDRDGKTVFEKLEGRFTYVPDRLGAVLAPWLPGKLEGAEEKSVSLILNGEAKTADVLGVLRGARGEVDLDLAKFTTQGISVSGRTKLTLEGGRMTSTVPLDVNRGKADLSGSIDFRDPRERPQSALDLKARDVNANANMGPLLESINPIFHTYNGTVDGKITSEFRLAWRGPVDPASPDPKKDVAKYLEGSGVLAVRDLNIAGSPAVGEIMKALGEGNSIRGDLMATDIRVGGGRCEYKNMTLRLKAYELRFTGWVDFYDETGKDRKSMHLMVEMPMTEGIVRRYPNLQKYIGKTFFVPLEGTVESPRFDFDGAIAELARRALEGVVQDKLEDALRRLLDRRKK